MGGYKKTTWYSGQDLFDDDFKARTFVGAHKDRLDHTIDRVRSIRTDQYRYVRNYKLDRIFCNHSIGTKNYTQNLHQLYHEEKLSRGIVRFTLASVQRRNFMTYRSIHNDDRSRRKFGLCR